MGDNKNGQEEMLEESVVVMTDEEGHEYYYTEEEVIAIGENRFAILVPVDEGEECGCGCHDHNHDDDDEDDAVIAKIVVDENGEDVYCDPTEEEFNEVLRIYEEG